VCAEQRFEKGSNGCVKGFAEERFRRSHRGLFVFRRVETASLHERLDL